MKQEIRDLNNKVGNLERIDVKMGKIKKSKKKNNPICTGLRLTETTENE